MTKEKSPNLYVLLPLSAVVFAFLCALGFWQLQRLEWKQSLITRIEARVNQSPLPLEDALKIWADMRDVEYLSVRLNGRFLLDQERYLYSVYNGTVGWEVFSPFVTDRGIVLVNRGFVPERFKHPETRNDRQISEIVEITGLLRETGVQGDFVPDNDVLENIWYWRDLPGMSTSMDLPQAEMLAFSLDLKTPAFPGQLPMPGTTRLDIPNKHFGYAVTWFALAVVLAIMVFLFIRKSNGKHHDAP